MARTSRQYTAIETAFLEGVATRVHAARVKAGLSQDALAERARLSRSHISKIERNEYEPQIVTLHRIAEALQLPLSVLLAGDDS